MFIDSNGDFHSIVAPSMVGTAKNDSDFVAVAEHDNGLNVIETTTGVCGTWTHKSEIMDNIEPYPISPHLYYHKDASAHWYKYWVIFTKHVWLHMIGFKDLACLTRQGPSNACRVNIGLKGNFYMWSYGRNYDHAEHPTYQVSSLTLSTIARLFI
jgi:hypothetical protein